MDWMGGNSSKHNLVGKSEEKKQLERPRCRREDYTRMDLEAVWCIAVNLILPVSFILASY
jgi:hypothetical protein